MDLTSPEVSISSISLHNGVVEITYLEKRHQSSGLGKAQTVFVDVEEHPKFRNLAAEIESLARELVDDLETDIRNPPETIRDPRFGGRVGVVRDA